MAKKKLAAFLIFLILLFVLLWKVPVKDIFQGELLRYLQSLVEENFLLAALISVPWREPFWPSPVSAMPFWQVWFFMLSGAPCFVPWLPAFPQESPFLWEGIFCRTALSRSLCKIPISPSILWERKRRIFSCFYLSQEPFRSFPLICKTMPTGLQTFPFPSTLCAASFL